MLTPNEAINERNREHGKQNPCRRCKHSSFDLEEGWLCRKYDAIIKFSNGSTMRWPFQAADKAFTNDCKGQGFEHGIIPALLHRLFGL